ncbi:hypothetical protein GE061_015530 [Apolygus lucorum]|uniref:Pacifastin domain-containing protein n=1 Tax=Apolygus lucorum TaxID=248454 RepID=A0A8S9XL91_APOLU|nr:hypothetical protein GE061_015530 [Apolygus lucorum]
MKFLLVICILAIFVAFSCGRVGEEWPRDPPEELMCTPGYESFWDECNMCWCKNIRKPGEKPAISCTAKACPRRRSTIRKS